MIKSYTIILDQAGKLIDFESLSDEVRTAARIAVNRATEKARTTSAKYVRQQINFPASYVSPSEGRLSVSVKANNDTLKAVVSARTRSTSLARFASGRRGKGGAMVEVEPGVSRHMRNVIFVPLKRGGEFDSNNRNEGLAMRTKGNRKPSAAYKPIQMKNGLWLLYGPSVSQALLSVKDTGIWPNMTDEIRDNMLAEFTRQLDLKNALR